MKTRFLRFLITTSALAIGLTAAHAQSPVARSATAAGSIVAAKGGEELRFVREDNWRAAELKQDILGGDTLRTNAIGNLAILFADRTQIRVGRNSTLTVSDVAKNDAGTTQLDLQSGNIWARAARGGTGVDVKTPAAVAAIRGTDWSLTVDGSGKTALVVLEGVVELKNAQGSVTVRQGEGAVASIGAAPTKFVLVNSDDREQMLFYMTLRDAFTSMSLSPLEGPALRAERARIEAIASERRKAEDWLSLAEIASYFDGRPLATQALAEARRFSLSGTQRARAELVEGVLAAAQRRWKDAATHFARAEQGGLDAKRRVGAIYGRYITQSLADPKRVQPEPKLNSNEPEAVLAHAYVVAFREGLPAAAKIIKEAEKRFPRNARVAIFAAQLAMALNQREDMRKAVERAVAIDADDPNVILTQASIRGEIDGEIDKAIVDLRRAAAVAPGNTDLWNGIGLFESTKDRPLAAEEAFRRAIAEDPESPVAYANLAILLLDQSRVDEAGALIEKALAIDPSFNVGYIALGRYLLQKGETAKGLEAILAGSTANPAYSQGLLLTAIAYYQNDDVELAEQALDNADRLDPNDPVVSIVRTAIALDQYRADEAIVSAREAVRRFRQRGGDFAGIAVNRQAGSYPAQAYRFLNLDEWARFYGDRVFDPFTGSSYFDQAAARRPSIFATRPTISSAQGDDFDLTSYTLTIQGLFFDPLAVSGRAGRTDLLRRPFIDTEFGGSLLVRNNRVGWEADASVQGFSNEPVPTSFSLAAGRALVGPKNSLDKEDTSNASFFIGMAPSAADRFLVFGSASTLEPGLVKVDNATRFFTGTQELTSLQAGAGWSHSFGDRNVLTGAVYAIRGIDQRYSKVASLDLFPFLVSGEQWARNRTEGVTAALSHVVGFGDFTLHYGVEGQKGRTFGRVLGNSLTFNFLTNEFDTVDIDDRTKTTFQATRLYADMFWRPSDRFEIQAGIEGDFLDIGSRRSEDTAAPRIGIGVSPFDGQWLRAAYRRDGVLPVSFTLSPVTTVGLAANNLPVSLGGRTDTMALRWDAEWTPQLFTSVEYQRQDVKGLEVPIINTFDTVSIDKGRIDRLAATANLWLGYGFGVFGTVGTLSSDVRSGDSFGADIPFVSGRFARAGVTFAHPSRLKVAVAATFVGDRKGNLAGLKLDDYWTTDANITWETPDRRMLFGLTFLNLFNQRFEFAPGVPGTGRTFAATIKARF
ncbi:FecR domain-containing protein [Microvirga terricola]|uniref:Tetratricopeptide repeat protein n=1 Tax=Microvirga terricola TaxID=2719797 RepID=A0ABX0V8J9_9HYPH|nr:FecR domain-containing protein [Microvirga terricola]NIX75306.1 tetratricopeptide repeat protein [Microvirga terricola]